MNEALYAVMIQITGDFLLLPNAAVSEVTALDRFEAAAADAPAWLAGWHATAERRIPVLSFEALSGHPRPEVAKRSRIVIVNPIGRRVGGGGFALLAQGHPHLISINRGTINPVNLLPADRDDLVLSRVRVAGQESVIPDLEQIEARLAGLA
jgi:chemosensory pili system protein ChpC